MCDLTVAYSYFIFYFQVSSILANPDTSEAFDNLCAKDWLKLLNLPEKKNVNFTTLQEEFCAINVSAIVPELYEEFSIQEVMDKVRFCFA